jgi:hypothetical protein
MKKTKIVRLMRRHEVAHRPCDLERVLLRVGERLARRPRPAMVGSNGARPSWSCAARPASRPWSRPRHPVPTSIGERAVGLRPRDEGARRRGLGSGVGGRLGRGRAGSPQALGDGGHPRLARLGRQLRELAAQVANFERDARGDAAGEARRASPARPRRRAGPRRPAARLRRSAIATSGVSTYAITTARTNGSITSCAASTTATPRRGAAPRKSGDASESAGIYAASPLTSSKGAPREVGEGEPGAATTRRGARA